MNQISSPGGTRMFGVIYFIFIKIGTKLPNGGNTVGDNSQVIRQIVPQIQNSVKKMFS